MPWCRARGVRELAGEPGPPFDLGEQVGDVDVRCEAIHVSPEPHGGRALLERVGRRELKATSNQTHAVAGVDRGLQAAHRLVLLGLELAQALVGVQCAAECDRELVAVGLPPLVRHQERRRVGVATPDRAKQPPGAQRIACDEPQPQLQAGPLDATLLIEHPHPPRLRQQLGRLIHESSVCGADPPQSGQQLLVGARRAA